MSVDLTPKNNAYKTFEHDHTKILYYVKESPRVLWIASVRTPAKHRGHGSARAALRLLLAEADAAGIPSMLGSSPLDKKTNPKKLFRFYESLGFYWTGKYINAAFDPEMRRDVYGVKPDEHSSLGRRRRGGSAQHGRGGATHHAAYPLLDRTPSPFQQGLFSKLGYEGTGGDPMGFSASRRRSRGSKGVDSPRSIHHHPAHSASRGPIDPEDAAEVLKDYGFEIGVLDSIGPPSPGWAEVWGEPAQKRAGIVFTKGWPAFVAKCLRGGRDTPKAIQEAARAAWKACPRGEWMISECTGASQEQVAAVVSAVVADAQKNYVAYLRSTREDPMDFESGGFGGHRNLPLITQSIEAVRDLNTRVIKDNLKWITAEIDNSSAFHWRGPGYHLILATKQMLEAVLLFDIGTMGLGAASGCMSNARECRASTFEWGGRPAESSEAKSEERDAANREHAELVARIIPTL